MSRLGTWMQATAQAWLVLELTGSGGVLGLVVGCQTLPVLLFGAHGGAIADRYDRRRLLLLLQVAMGVLAAALGVVVVLGVVALWHVLVLAALLGLLNAVELPVRQVLMGDMVGGDAVRSAVSLSSVLNNVARACGPAAAGAVIDAGGLGLCFLINAASYAAVTVSLLRMNPDAFLAVEETAADDGIGGGPAAVDSAPSDEESQDAAKAGHHPPPAGGSVREGLRYVAGRPELSVPLLMLFVVGTLTVEFPVTLPVLAAQVLHGDATTFGAISAGQGIGAILGGLYTAARDQVDVRAVRRSVLLFGVAMAAVTVAPGVLSAAAAMVAVGACNIAVFSRGNVLLQVRAQPAFRGRVMALFAVATMGTTPVGGPLVGLLGEQFGGRSALALGAVACLAAALIGLRRNADRLPVRP